MQLDAQLDKYETRPHLIDLKTYSSNKQQHLNSS